MKALEREKRETYPWEKADARRARVRIGPRPEFEANPAPYNDRLPPLGISPVSRESNHPSFEALKAFKANMDEQRGLDLAGRSAGGRSGLYTAPVPLLNTPAVHEYGMIHTGEVIDLPDYDGRGFEELCEAEEHDKFYSDSEAEGLRLRDSEYVFFCKNRAGELADAEAKAKADAARVKMNQQQMDLALGLASQGIQAFLPAHAPRMSIVDPFSEQVIEIPPVRRVNFFPPVAKARRASMLVHLNAWMEKHPKTRMLTFTSGQRVRLDRPGEVRGRFQFLARRISNLNAHPYIRRIGLRMSFRASEAGTFYRACPFPREAGTESGVIYAHIHAHVFAEFEHQLSPGGYKKFLRRVKSIWRYHWDYGTQVADPAEACKYPVKPGDLEILTDAEKAAWYREVFKLHIVQPLGELRETIAARQESALKGRKWRTRDKSTGQPALELRFRPDWNARPRLTAAQRNARAAMRERMRRLGLAMYSDAAELLSYANGLLSFEKRVRKDEMRVIQERREELAQCLSRARHRGAPAFSLFSIEAALHAANRQQPTFRLSVADNAALLAQVAQLRAAAVTLLTCARPAAEKRWLGIQRLKQIERENRPQKFIRNQVVARIGPAPMFTGDRVFRPTLAVWNFDRSPAGFAALRELPFVREYGEAVAAKLAAAEAQARSESTAAAAGSYHRVHTSHITATRARGGADPGQGQLLAKAEAWTHKPDPKLTPADLILGRN